MVPQRQKNFASHWIIADGMKSGVSTDIVNERHSVIDPLLSFFRGNQAVSSAPSSNVIMTSSPFWLLFLMTIVLSNTRNIAAVSNRQAMIKSCQSACVIHQESNHMISCKGWMVQWGMMTMWQAKSDLAGVAYVRKSLCNSATKLATRMKLSARHERRIVQERNPR